MNKILNNINATDFIGTIVRCSENTNYIEDVVVSADVSEDKLRLHLVTGELVLTNFDVKDKQ